MKKALLTISTLLLALCCIFAVGCGNNTKDITGVTFTSVTYNYDGTEKSILISGTLPEGVSVSYKDNKATDTGTYNAVATLSGEGYKTLVLNATLTINGTDISGITFNNATYDYDETKKTLLVSGTLPEGVAVAYENNEGTNSGVYNAKATLTGKGYNTLTLTATLTINKLTYNMENASWNYVSNFTYDGNEKTVCVDGLPAGVTVENYTENSKTNAGSYTASVSLKYDELNHNKPSINDLQWVIDKANITTAVFNDQTITEDGNKHIPTISGLPSGTTKTFSFNNVLNQEGVSKIGSYSVKVLLKNDNYNDLTLTCTFKIKIDAVAFAKKVIAAYGSVPKPWSFLPESFAPENHTLSVTPNYDNFVNVSTIPTNGIGKQLNVVYGVLNKTTKALSYLNSVYGVFNTLQTAYVTFLDDKIDNYTKTFNYEKGAVSLALSVAEKNYTMTASVSGISINIFANLEDKSYGAKVQLTSSNVLKYTVKENYLKIAFVILNSASTQIEFIRNDNKVVGYIYEHLVVSGKELTSTSAMLTVDNTYTTLIGTKGDFIPTAESRNCEVYLNSTGKLAGTEVRELLNVKSLGDALYNTLWYNLYSITGITSIKKVDEVNGLNPDTIYINNNSSDTIHTKTFGGVSKKSLSRRFDIEFKKMYFYTLNGEGEYESTTCEIPLMFIQEEVVGDFESDFESKNDVAVTLNVSKSVKTAVNFGYYTLLVDYDKIKDAVTNEAIINYCK